MSPTCPRRLLVAAGVVALALCTAPPAPAEPDQPPRVPGQVRAVAGLGEPGYSGDGWPATQARLGSRPRVEVGPDGSVLIADPENGRLRRVDPDGVIDTVPGTRAVRSPETDGPEHSGWIYSPSNRPRAAAVAADGTVYLAAAQDLRRIGRTGKHTVIGGNGELSFTDGDGGDGGPATAAWIYKPEDIAVDGARNVYVADRNNSRVRRIDARGTISTVAGGGKLALASAEGAPATGVRIPPPTRVAVDDDGSVYFSTEGGSEVHRVGRDGRLATVATLPGRRVVGGIDVDAEGTLYLTDQSRGLVHEVGEDGSLNQVGPGFGQIAHDLAVGPDGDVYVAGDAAVLRLVRTGDDLAGAAPEPAPSRWAGDEPGTVHTVAGTGPPRDELGPPPPPEQDLPPGPTGMAVGPDGTVYVAEPLDNRVRRIDETGRVTGFAGTGEREFGGDGEPAEEARLSSPQAVAVDTDGNVYIADTGNDRIRRVDADGIISTFATVPAPWHVTVDPAGTVYATSAEGEQVLRVGERGQPAPVAGGGRLWADKADNAPARQAQLWEPHTVAAGPDSTLYFVEHDKPAVRAIRRDGTLVTVAGSSYRGLDEGGFGGDGGPATRSELNTPSGLAIGQDGSRYVADTYNNRVRRIDRNGTITTVAGTGERADRGDGGPATKAALTEPTGVAVGPDGALYVTGATTPLVRRIGRDGTITTLADLTPERKSVRATDTELRQIQSVAVGPDGTVYVCDVSGTMHEVAPDGTIDLLDLDLHRRDLPGAAPVATGPDGSLYLGTHEIVRRAPDGTAVVVAGTLSDLGPPAPDQQATAASIRATDLATRPDGELYLISGETVYVLRAGKLAKVLADAGKLGGIAVGPDGTLYAVAGNRVLAVRDGRPEPVAGTGESSSSPGEEEDEDGGPALEASLSYPADVAVTPDGSLFVSTTDGIRRVDAEGDIETVVPAYRTGEESYPAGALAVGPGGDLYFAEPGRHQVRVVVRPAELDGPFRFPWTAFWITALVLAAGVVLMARRRRARPAALGEERDPVLEV